MISKNSHWISERGWTFIEATMGVILMSILVLGLAVTILAMRDTMDRSLTIRVMDQYGNDVMRHFQIIFENAVGVDLIASQSSGNMDHFRVQYRDPFDPDLPLTNVHYRATQNLGILRDGQRLDPHFPPTRVPRGQTGLLQQGETFTVTKFTISNTVKSGNIETFNDGVWQLTLGLRYTKHGSSGEPDFRKDMTYTTLLLAKNAYLPPIDLYR